MNLRALRTLATIMTNGSFAGTAAWLNMTGSAVSMQMKTLEQELGVALFDRSFRPPALTPIGRLVAERAQVMLRANDDLLDACRSHDVISGEFRMGFIPSSSVRLLPRFLSGARRQYPNAHFKIETGLSEDLIYKVISGHLDAAVITYTDETPASVSTVTLMEEELVFCVPASSSAYSIDECMNKMTFIHFMPRSGIGRLIAQYLAKSGLVPNDTLVLDSVEAVAKCVIEGIGFSILPAPDIMLHLTDQITLRSLLPSPIKRKVVLATIRDGRMKSYVEPLAKLLS